MTVIPTPETMNRTAKLFMDRSEVKDYAEAIKKLEGFRLAVVCGPEVMSSPAHQFALLTLVNAGRRTFLGGVTVVMPNDAPLLVAMVDATTLAGAVIALQGEIGDAPADVPLMVIGSAQPELRAPAWQLTWDGWRGGVIPLRENARLPETGNIWIVAGMASAIALSEAFRYFDGQSLAGKLAVGASLWSPGKDWRTSDPEEPALQYLPRDLWVLGLGNLGQAYLWMLGVLPFPDGQKPRLTLQDFDRVSEANDSTSVFSQAGLVGTHKTRAMAAWAERIGWDVAIIEQRFGPWTRRVADEPLVALCGFDNALARAALEDAQFDLVVEAGLGAGAGAFMNFSVHTFPASRKARDIWKENAEQKRSAAPAPAYTSMLDAGAIDECGLALLASRSVGVPFVSLTAAAFVMAELLRRLHGGVGLEAASGSLSDLNFVEAIERESAPYSGGFASLTAV